jgi:hypothetical protein
MLLIQKQQALERWDILPDEIREVLVSENSTEIIERITKEEHIAEEKISKISRISGYVFMGFLHPEETVRELQEALQIDIKIAENISKALNTRLFAPYKNQLEKIYASIMQGKKEGVKLEIKNAESAENRKNFTGGPKIIATNTTIQPIGSVRTEVKETHPATLTPFQMRTNQNSPTAPQAPSKIPMPNAVDLRGAAERIEVKNSNTLNLKNTTPVSTPLPKAPIQTPSSNQINPVKIALQPATFEARREIPNIPAPIKPLISEPIKNQIQNTTPSTTTSNKPVGQETNIFEQLKNLEKSGSELVNVLRIREEKTEPKSGISTPDQNIPKPQLPTQNIQPVQKIEPKIPTPTPKPAMGPVMIHQETKVTPITQRINQNIGAPRMPIQPTNQIGAISQNSGSLNLNKIDNQSRDANPGWLKAIFGKPTENDSESIKTVSFSEKEELQNQPPKITPPPTRPVTPELKQNTERPLTPQNPVKSTPLTKPNLPPTPQQTTMDIQQPGAPTKKNEPMIDLGKMERL